MVKDVEYIDDCGDFVISEFYKEKIKRAKESIKGSKKYSDIIHYTYFDDDNGDVVYMLDKKPTLQILQELVDGYIEVIKLPMGQFTKDVNGSIWEKKKVNAQMIVNEEGLLKGLFHNEYASKFANRDIVGNAVILFDKARLK